ncbi:glucokinase [Shimia gijangensis]|uniref:Glucokinase n=1 Tax=Shimia gijangensis TaxID=1470563 RepID=A0A1M6CJG3_9RHOB|nr:ROK family protein [Shimia gijangensis]SHI61136.1 glucokinase [Shimia gijangensis]
MKYLVGDIGGTNTRLALADPSGVNSRTQRHYQNDLFGTFDEVLEQFRDDAGATGIDAACLAIAGPVGAAAARLTNRDWTFDAARIGKALKTDSVVFINDLAALSYALSELNPTRLYGPKSTPDEVQSLIVGMGTGFNVSLSKRTSESSTVAFEAELGHAALPSPIANMLADHLGCSISNTPRVEDWMCGSGLERIYQLMSGESLPSREIMQRFEVNSDQNATQSVEVFAQVLGKLGRQMVYQYMPRAGLFFAGSVARSVLKSDGFVHFERAFSSGDLGVVDVAKISVSLIEEDAAALQGCVQVLLDVTQTTQPG